MVPRFNDPGKSFKGLGRYLTHDPRAETTHRVAWTHTLNCAFDHVPSAVDEMVSTWRDAALLKEQAGVRRGGRELEAPVKHVSLNWHPSERPTREAMIATTEDFLAHMGWRAHQAVLVAHNDKPHAHVHLMVNAVHPETGRKLDDGLEWRRAQKWALAYEREHGVFCEQRLRAAEEREPSPPRWLWDELKAFDAHRDRGEAAQREHGRDPFAGGLDRDVANEEWRVLKAAQRQEREAFHAEGKQAYGDLRRTVYRDVREAYRGEWSDYYAARRVATPTIHLDLWRTDILARQREELTGRRETACAELRETRDEIYADLLARQRGEKAELRGRQRQGDRSQDLLDRMRARIERTANQNERETNDRADETDRGVAPTVQADAWTGGRDGWNEARPHISPSATRSMRGGADIVSRVGVGVIGGIASFGERLFEGLFGHSPPRRRALQPPHPRPVPPPANDAGEAARRAAELDAEEARRRAAWWEEREQARD